MFIAINSNSQIVAMYMLQYSFPPCSFVQGKSEKLALEETAFEEIERDFQEVLNELSGDKSLEKFRIEYEKLHAVMKDNNSQYMLSMIKFEF